MIAVRLYPVRAFNILRIIVLDSDRGRAMLVVVLGSIS
jgi:hypothetical protein